MPEEEIEVMQGRGSVWEGMVGGCLLGGRMGEVGQVEGG